MINPLRKKIKTPMDAISFKVKAFEVDLQFAMDVRKFEFVIEGDSMIASQALSEQSPPPL